MTIPADQHSLVHELDTRQNEVLDQLEELNSQVEALLKECLSTRDPE